ncbi:MAG TPA: hypothetical protein VJ816_10075 [Gemmatimonadales bacterium]|nr:hypothetical protein [Gemmatimonadales bacterium]
MTEAPETRGPIARIQVGKAGEIWLDGARTTLEALRPQLAQLRAKNGVVWYHRAATGAEPAPEAMAVIQLVIEHRLPISMSLRPDFSDVVRADGSVAPRRGPHTLS